MDTESLFLARLLALSGLVGGAVQYAHLVRRRVLRRREHSDEVQSGLQAIVRISLADEQRRAAQEAQQVAR